MLDWILTLYNIASSIMLIVWYQSTLNQINWDQPTSCRLSLIVHVALTLIVRIVYNCLWYHSVLADLTCEITGLSETLWLVQYLPIDPGTLCSRIYDLPYHFSALKKRKKKSVIYLVIVLIFSRHESTI